MIVKIAVLSAGELKEILDEHNPEAIIVLAAKTWEPLPPISLMALLPGGEQVEVHHFKQLDARLVDYQPSIADETAPRTSYPIPEGYRMLDRDEFIQEGDFAWSEELLNFVEIEPESPLIGGVADVANCIIRPTVIQSVDPT